MGKSLAKHKIGAMVQTTYLIRGEAGALPTGSWVVVKEIARLRKGVIRYRVMSAKLALYWVDADAIEALGSPAYTEGEST